MTQGERKIVQFQCEESEYFKTDRYYSRIFEKSDHSPLSTLKSAQETFFAQHFRQNEESICLSNCFRFYR